MFRKVYITTLLGQFCALAILPFSYAQLEGSASEQLKIGRYEIRSSETIEAGVPHLKISVSADPSGPVDHPDYRVWKKSRFENGGDRFGIREYWLKDPAHLSLDFNWPVLDSGTLQLELVASDRDLSHLTDWGKLDLIPKPKAYFAALERITRFYLAHESLFIALDHELSPDHEVPNHVSVNGSGDFHRFVVLHGQTPWISPLSLAKESEYVQAMVSHEYSGFMEKARYHTQVPNQPLLIVVHASSVFNGNESAKPKMDQLISSFKRDHHPVAFLIHDDNLDDYTWFTQDRKADVQLYSFGGEHSLLIRNPDVTLVGGYFDQCFRRAVQDTISRYFLQEKGVLRLHLPMAGIYTTYSSTLSSDFESRAELKDGKFLRVVERALFDFGQDDQEFDREQDLKAVGDLDPALYQYHIYLNGKSVGKRGHGPRKVQLLFTSEHSV